MAKKRLAVTISGRVHGVGFRFFSRDAAKIFGLTGWVRNTPHRTVEIEIQGESAVLELFCEKIRQGPRLSHVEEVNITELPVQHTETSFDIFH
jgi:acylphosphatase